MENNRIKVKKLRSDHMSTNYSLKDLNSIAVNYARQGKWDKEAVKVNLEIIKNTNGNSDAYTRLAKCFKLLGNYSDALKVYNKVLEFNPQNRIALNNIDEVKERLENTILTKQSFEGIIPVIETYISENETQSSSFNTMDINSKIQEQYGYENKRDFHLSPSNNMRTKSRERERYISENLAINIKTFEEAKSIIADAKHKKDFELELAAIKKALDFKQNDSICLNRLAKIYRDLRRLTEAEEIYRKVISENKYNKAGKIAKVGLAAVLRDMNKPYESIQIYSDVLIQENDNIFALNGIGAVHMDLHQYGAAETYFTRVRMLEMDKNTGESSSVDGIRKLLKRYEEIDDKDGIQRLKSLLKLI